MNITRWCCNIALLFTVFGGQFASAEQAAMAPLACYPVPGQPQQLCMLVTASPYGPFDDVAFYKRDAEQQLTYLRSASGLVARFSFQGFSPEGRFVILAWAEEGHPLFTIYRTADLLQQGEPQAVAAISDYPFSHIDSISEQGLVIYGSEQPYDPEHCIKPSVKMALADPANCHRKLQLEP